MFNHYRELGLSLIPIKIGAKRPDCSPFSTDEWQRFCDRLPTEEECDAWESQHKRYGVTLGRASKIMAIDIDSDDKNIINACPLSPVIKRGRKGETRFFRYDPEVPSCKVAGIIDILAHGRQTLLPPTIHPETNEPYVWLTPDTLDNYDIKDLPIFTAADLAELRAKLEPKSYDTQTNTTGIEIAGGPWMNNDPKRMCPHGSHDRLKVIANALIGRGASPDEALRELLRYDDENHKPTGYFSDPTRAECTADPVTNALLFYASNAKTFNRRQIQNGQMPVMPLVSGAELIDISALNQVKTEAWQPVAWPEPKGILKEIRDQIAEYSLRDQPALAIGGAIAIASVAIANKLRIDEVWPNVYVLNIAHTGAGKSFPYTTAKRILNNENDLDLLGAGGYRSSTALIKDLVGRRERLDLIDECSSLFNIMKEGGIFQSEMLDMLNDLFTGSHSIYIGPESAGRERINVWHPSISILFSTTPDGLKGSMSREFVTKGFIPRCLIFHDSEYGKIKKPVWNEVRLKHIVESLQKFKNIGKEDRKNLVAIRPSPVNMVMDDAARSLLDAYAHECNEKLATSDEIEKHFLIRAGQLATKLTLIHGALRADKIELCDVQWAIEMMGAIWHNSGPLLPQMGAENIQEKNVLRVIQIIKKTGSIDHSQLISKTRFLKTNERNEILTSLSDEGRLFMTYGDKKAKIWNFIK